MGATTARVVRLDDGEGATRTRVWRPASAPRRGARGDVIRAIGVSGREPVAGLKTTERQAPCLAFRRNAARGRRAAGTVR